MCLRLSSEAINNTRAMNSQPGWGIVPQQVEGSSRMPARGTQVSNCVSFAYNKNLWGVGRWVISKLHHFAEALTHGDGVSTVQNPAHFSHPGSGRCQLAGPLQYLRLSAVLVDCSFFVHATHNCGYYNKRRNGSSRPSPNGPQSRVWGDVSHS